MSIQMVAMQFELLFGGAFIWENVLTELDKFYFVSHFPRMY